MTPSVTERKPYYPRNTCAMMPGQVDSWCQPSLTLLQNRFFLEKKNLPAQATFDPRAWTLTDNRR